MTSAHPANDIRIFHKECASLADLGYQVHLVAAGTLAPDNKGVTLHALPTSPQQSRMKRMVLRAWHTWRLARKTGADLFHFHDPELLPYGLLLKWQGKTVVYDAHEDLPRDIMTKNWIPGRLRHSISRLAEIGENFIAKRLDLVVAATPFICQRFQTAGIRSIDIKNYPLAKEREQAINPPNLDKSTPALCYVGMISLPRGIIEMMQAAARLSVKLIIAGSFIDKKTEERVRSLPEWQFVDYRGTVSRHEVVSILAESQLGLCILHPSSTHTDSLPNKLFEYMSAGLPVLASNFPTWQPIVEEVNCGFCVDPYNLDAMTQSIQWILDNPEDAVAMGKRGQLAVEQRYSWETEAHTLDKAYETIRT
jgi:glycosyltransferase involved in cell wall biosynthesis